MPRRHPTIYSKKSFISAPANLVASQVAALPDGLMQIRLTWTNTRPDLSTETFFSDGRWTGVNVGPGVSSTLISGLVPGTTYSFYVTHTPDGQKRSLPSNTAGATTQTMAVPTNLVVSQIPTLPQGTSQLLLTWTPAHPSYSTEVWDQDQQTWRGNAGAGASSIVIGGFPPSSAWGFYVRHFVEGQGFVSGWSNHSWNQTQAAFPAPAGLVATVPNDPAQGQTQVLLSWTNTGFDQIAILQWNGSYYAWVANAAPGATSFTFGGLSPGSTYAFRIQYARYTDTWYLSDPANDVGVTTQQYFAPPWINDVIVQPFPAGMTTVNWYWSNANGNDYANFYVNGTFIGGPNPNPPGALGSYATGGLTKGATGTFEMTHSRYTDRWYETARSNAVVRTMLADLPKPVWQNVYVPAPPGGMSQVMLQWYYPGAIPNFTHVLVIRDGAWLAFVGATTTSYLDTGLNPNQTYTYTLMFHDTNTGYLGPVSDAAPRTTLDHLRFTADYYNYAGGSWDLTAGEQPMFVAAGPVQGHFNRTGRVNWYACAGGGGGGAGRADFTVALGGGGGGGGSGANHPGGTLHYGTAGYSYYFEVGGGGGGGGGNASPGAGPGGGGAGARSIVQEHDGVQWTVFLYLNGGGGGAPGTQQYRAAGGAGGTASVGNRGGDGGLGGAETAPPTGGNSEWTGGNSGGAGGGGGSYQLGSGNGGYGINGGGGGAPDQAGANAGGYGGQPAVGAADPRGGGGGGGAGLWGPYGGGGGGGGGLSVVNSGSYRGGDGGGGWGGFVIIQNAE